QTEKLAQQGTKELILIAQDLTYYGLDLYQKRALATLIEKLSEVEGIEWIRLHYAYPSGFPMEVIDVMKSNPKICNYLDIPLQHISDNMLKKMRRGITKEKTIRLINEIRNKIPEITLRTTLISGFPGETEQDFEELYHFVETTQFDRVGIFPYSHEENTFAYQYPDDVSQETKMERANIIMDLQSRISLAKNQAKIGTVQKAIIDRFENKHFIGRTEADSPEVDNEVLIPFEKDLNLKRGEFYDITITDAEMYDLIGKPKK
ncbi:MAG: MiaB/RimO family radical SAM methylthiotransferase, partial [Bacteroidetes bacterium]